MSLMLNEIQQQADIIRGLCGCEGESVLRVADEVRKRDIRFVILAARGTSDHAAIYGKYLLEIRNHFPVGLADASVFTIYDAQIRMDNVLVIGVSQSGEATDVGEYLFRSKANGALTVGITNNAESSISRIADHTLYCCAGPEKAVAATKTYTSTLALFYMLSSALTDDRGCENKLALLADGMDCVMGLEGVIRNRAERYRYMQSGVVISRGFNFCTALEMSLKLAETCYIAMRGYSAADFLHGPIASIHENDPCFIIAPAGKMVGVMGESIRKLSERGAETIVISSEDSLLSQAVLPLKIGCSVEEELSPLLYIVPGQLFAYYLSLSRRLDPDNPVGLSKVTLTL